MSAFITKIPVDLAKTLQALPKHSYVEGVQWNGTELELRWSNHLLTTAWTFHAPFELKELLAQRLPEGVKQRPPMVLPKPPVMTSKAGSVASNAAPRKGSARAKAVKSVS